MAGCPFAPKGARGAHALLLVVPDDDRTPVLAICERGCGHAERYELAVPARVPADELPADAIARLVRRPR